MNKLAAVATAAALAAGVVVGIGDWDAGGARPAYALLPPDAPAYTTSASPAAAIQPRATCPTTARPFVPKRITVAHVTKKARVVAPPRVNGVPGAPPLTTAGKEMFAWDSKFRRPGAKHGNVLLNAHVWPDGSAVGNRLLANLHKGDRIVLFGRTRKLCYRVTDRIQVYPRQALRLYYHYYGKPQVALVTCSGRRLGPGRWEKRTIWFASPHS